MPYFVFGIFSTSVLACSSTAWYSTDRIGCFVQFLGETDMPKLVFDYGRFCVGLSMAVAIGFSALTTTHGAENKGDAMSYGEVRDFLAKHTKLVELSDVSGARVAVAPGWQGRVMTSTCGGLEGASFGFVNRAFVEAGKLDLHMNNPGAEERMWLCPEGGPFSLWFKPGDKQVMANWFTPPAINETAWKVTSEPQGSTLRMTSHMEFRNTADTPFTLDAVRDVRLLGRDDFSKLFGDSAAALIGRSGVKVVGYETGNQITNRGPAFSKEKGLVSIWMLGMMNAGPETVILVPYRSGSESELGPVVKSDYFGSIPADRLIVTPEVVLFRADGHLRSKIGTSQRRARNVLGSIDFKNNVLTIVHFTMPDDPTQHNYMNNMWGVPQAKPYVGDVANAYNDGPNDLGQQMGAFYEIESVSPALVLKTDETLVHRHRTIHIQADPMTLHKLAKDILGVDLDAVRKAMFGVVWGIDEDKPQSIEK
jgi:hypothetical protein